MCALEHLWTPRITEDELIKIFKDFQEQERVTNLKKTKEGRIQLLKEDLHFSNSYCFKCGKQTSTQAIIRLPQRQLHNYLGHILDTGQPLGLMCCVCMTKFINAHFIRKENVKGLTLHGDYWINYVPKSRAPKLILPPCPTDLVTEAMEIMFDLPEGAEVFVTDPEPIRMVITGRHFRLITEIENRMYPRSTLPRGF